LNTSRRDFFKISLLGSAVLLVGSGLSNVLLAKSVNVSVTDRLSFLQPIDAEFLLALAPSILSSNFSGNNTAAVNNKANQRLLKSIDQQIMSLGEHSQKQLRQLFDLLTSSTLRYLAGAPISDWSTASTKQIEDFLMGWKNSVFALKRTGYGSLVKLLTMNWYTQAENYHQAGYPGPPKIYLLQE
jgi:hypothetical protein